MRIVLREDIEKVGKRGDVVKVAPGYGRNYLIPKKLAYLATPGNLTVIAHEARAKNAKDLKERSDFEAIAQRIASFRLSIAKKVGENDAVFGSVTSQEIADLLAAKGVEVDRRRIQLDEPIRTLGTHTVPVKLHKDVSADITIEVVKED